MGEVAVSDSTQQDRELERRRFADLRIHSALAEIRRKAPPYFGGVLSAVHGFRRVSGATPLAQQLTASGSRRGHSGRVQRQLLVPDSQPYVELGYSIAVRERLLTATKFDDTRRFDVALSNGLRTGFLRALAPESVSTVDERVTDVLSVLADELTTYAHAIPGGGDRSEHSRWITDWYYSRDCGVDERIGSTAPPGYEWLTRPSPLADATTSYERMRREAHQMRDSDIPAVQYIGAASEAMLEIAQKFRFLEQMSVGGSAQIAEFAREFLQEQMAGMPADQSTSVSDDPRIDVTREHVQQAFDRTWSYLMMSMTAPPDDVRRIHGWLRWDIALVDEFLAEVDAGREVVLDVIDARNGVLDIGQELGGEPTL